MSLIIDRPNNMPNPRLDAMIRDPDKYFKDSRENADREIDTLEREALSRSDSPLMRLVYRTFRFS